MGVDAGPVLTGDVGLAGDLVEAAWGAALRSAALLAASAREESCDLLASPVVGEQAGLPEGVLTKLTVPTAGRASPVPAAMAQDAADVFAALDALVDVRIKAAGPAI
jgi:hypothetical protein